MSDDQIGEFWRISRVLDETALKRANLYKKIRQGLFPAPFKYGRSSVWSSTQIRAWQQSVVAGRYWNGAGQ